MRTQHGIAVGLEALQVRLRSNVDLLSQGAPSDVHLRPKQHRAAHAPCSSSLKICYLCIHGKDLCDVAASPGLLIPTAACTTPP